MFFAAMVTSNSWLVLLPVLLGATPRYAEAGGCQAGWTLNENHCYFFSTSSETWNSARGFCQTHNSDLVKIENAQENSFLTQRLQAHEDYWIGLSDSGSEDNWVWASDNSYVSFKNWSPGEPNNLGSEDCGTFEGKNLGQWNDLSCSISIRFICEGPQKIDDIVYRVRVKAGHHGQPDGYVVLGGDLTTGVDLPLSGMGTKEDGLREGEITASDVGTISSIQYRETYSNTENPEFVSIYKTDVAGFYIERFDDNTNEKPCVRHFGEAAKLQPDPQHVKSVQVYSVKDPTDCQLRCVEMDKFDCRIVYYSSEYNFCHILGQSNHEYYKQTSSTRAFLFNRTDNCRITE